MKDRLALLISGVLASLIAWATWHWWGEEFTLAFIVILLLGFGADNCRLRRQVHRLLVERERRRS